MKNLKQVLALGMAFSLTMSAMAGAAFTDQDSINKENVDAVQLLSTLDIIKGYEDGSFNPTKPVTRAEMAKMIYTIRNGGNANADAYKSVSTSFTDIQGHWAEGYIKYLQSTDIIAGKSATKFDPDSTVTTVEAMKMALVLGGYRADKAGIYGAQWANKTISLATTNGLTDDVYSSMDGGCTRQDAAQILANVLEMDAVQWSEVTQSFLKESDAGLSWGSAPMSVGNKWMDLEIETGFVTRAPSSKTNPKGITVAGVNFNNVSMDVSDLLGYEVKVVYDADKQKKNEADAIYGIYKTEDNTSYETVWNQVDKDGNKIRFDGVSYDMESTVDVYADKTVDRWTNPVSKFDNKNTRELSDKVVFIDNDADGKIEAVQIKTQDVAQVTYVGSNTLATKDLVNNETVRNSDEEHEGVFYETSAGVYDYDADVELKDVNVYEGIAKDDYAKVSYDYFNDKVTYEKIEVQQGKVDSTRTTSSGTKEIRIDGNWYKPAEGYKGSMPSIVSGDTVSYVAIGELLYNVEKTDGLYGSKYIATVVDLAKYDVGFDTNKIQIKLQTRDGGSKTAILDKYDNKGVEVLSANAGNFDLSTVNVDINGNGTVNSSATPNADTADNVGALRTFLQGQLLAYRESGSNVSLVPISDTQKAGYKYQFDVNSTANIDGTHANGYGDGKVVVTGSDKDNITGTFEIADDAVVLLWNNKSHGASSHNAKTMTGKAAKAALKNNAASVVSVGDVATGELVNGVYYVQAITIQVNDVDKLNAIGNNYAYVLAAGEVVDDYRELHLWTANGAVTVYESTDSYYEFDGGEIITYDVKSTSDDRTVINNVKEIAISGNIPTKAQLGTVTSNGLYEDGTAIAIGGTKYDLAKNCQVVNVNTLDMTGISSGEEAKSAVRYGIDGKSNILYVTDAASKEIVFILVDSANEEIITKEIENPTAAQIHSMLKYAKSGETIVIKGTVPADTYNIPAGVVVDLSDATLNGNVVFNGTVVAGSLTPVTSWNVTISGKLTINGTFTASNVKFNSGATVEGNGKFIATTGVANVDKTVFAAFTGDITIAGQDKLPGDVYTIGNDTNVSKVTK